MENTDFTPRMKQIILALLANQGPVPVQRLAEQVHISKRTVQRELEYFPRALKKYDIAFCSKTGTGVWVEGSSGSRERLKAELEARGHPGCVGPGGTSEAAYPGDIKG